MELAITFPGANRVDARFGQFTVETDQPPQRSAPTPFELFLASIGTCAGVYVLGFLRQRQLPTEGLRIRQLVRRGDEGMVTNIDLEVELPPGVPEKYRGAIVRAAEQCSVKKHLEHPPAIAVTTVQPAAAPPVPVG